MASARSRIVQAVIAVVLLLAVLAFAYVQQMRPVLQLGVGYGARVACGCRYFGNRPLQSCTADFEPGMEAIRLREDAAARTVTAYVPLLASRTVRFDPVLGCQPQPLEGEGWTVRHDSDTPSR